ncbi:MAG: DUF1566 domain-containing protein, partial [Campylobacterota bacterium]|nr:DUF1566 domain-containing protein [Campylobacterota bacterium]
LKTWNDAKNYCQNLWSYQYDSKIDEDWRLPTLEELYTIYNKEGASHVYKEFDELSKKPFGYWSSNTLLISVMNWYKFKYEDKPAATVLMYEDNYERNFELHYDMNVMCVTNFVE